MIASNQGIAGAGSDLDENKKVRLGADQVDFLPAVRFAPPVPGHLAISFAAEGSSPQPFPVPSPYGAIAAGPVGGFPQRPQNSFPKTRKS